MLGEPRGAETPPCGRGDTCCWGDTGYLALVIPEPLSFGLANLDAQPGQQAGG